MCNVPYYSQDQMVYLTPPSCCCSQMDSSHKETEEVDRPHQWPVYFKDEHSQSFSSNFSLPSLNWADSKEVWKIMLAKEHRYPREKEMLKKHPALQARMRAILLDWLTEVSC